MRFCFSKSMLGIATLSALLSLGGNAEDSIKHLVRDLKEHKRYIFAVGTVSSSVVLFVSGSSNKTDFNNGYQVKLKEEEPADGKFGKLENAVALSKYTGITSADVMFVASDSASSFLVTMNSSSVELLDLSSGFINSTGIKGDFAIGKCYKNGSLHLSSSTPGTFFVLDLSGAFLKQEFNTLKDIPSSVNCYVTKKKRMCLNNSSSLVTISSSCKGTPLPTSTFTAGFVSGLVYLFSSSNEVYFFESSAIESGQTVPLTKVSSDAAWDHSSSHSQAESYNSTFYTTIATFVILVLSLILCCVIVYFARCHCSRDLIQIERFVLFQRGKEDSNLIQQQGAVNRKRRLTPNAYVTKKMLEKRRKKTKRAAKEKAAEAVAAASASASRSADKSKRKGTSDGSRSPKTQRTANNRGSTRKK